MKSFRPERVAQVIREVVSEAIANKLNDPRIEPLSSVTRVEVSADLEHAKVWVSVMGEASAGRRTLAGLKAAAGYVQRLTAAELSLRTTPHLTFHLDESLKKAAQTIRLIDESMAEIRQREAAAGAPADQPDDPACGDRA
ncbi:MAG: 30S ribosome-binding factor RbfA [Phycisphaerae bacterium]|jgi:ribosome-binding factor A